MRWNRRHEVGRVRRHAISQIGSIRLAEAAEIGSDPTPTFESPYLVAPDRSVERITMNEQDTPTLPLVVEREVHSIDRDPGGPRPCGGLLGYQLVQILRHRDRFALAIDAHEDKLACRDGNFITETASVPQKLE